jgi:integrase
MPPAEGPRVQSPTTLIERWPDGLVTATDGVLIDHQPTIHSLRSVRNPPDSSAQPDSPISGHRLILRLERARKITPGPTLHGRRHTLGDELANLGADPRMIQAVLGHRSMAASLHYSAGADRRRAASATVELLEKRPRK